MATTLEIKYFNTFWAKKTVNRPFTPNSAFGQESNIEYVPNFNGLPFYKWDSTTVDTRYLNFWDGGLGNNPGAVKPDITIAQGYNWFIEESRIKGGYNNTSTDYGVKAYLVDKDYISAIKDNKVIYSGLFNSDTNVNETNVFSEATQITFTAPPEYGSIQKLYASDTKLHIFQQNKVSRALLDKDAIYAANGQGTPVSTTKLVIGEINPYVGEYGISTNPESWAQFGNRQYFADKNRNSIMRLSNDGLTPISDYGMADFFRDKLSEISEEDRILTVSDTVDSQSPAINPTPPYYPTPTPILPGEPYLTKALSGVGPYYANVPIGARILINGVETGCFVESVDQANGKIKITDLIPFYFPASSIIEFITYTKDQVLGAYDVYTDNYTLSIQRADDPIYHTLTFDERARGWVTFYDYKPTHAVSMFNRFYSTTGASLWIHNASDEGIGAIARNSFYGKDAVKSSIEFIFNDNPNIVKVFKTVNYEGSNGWEVISMTSDETGRLQEQTGSWTNFTDTVNIIKSYTEGAYIENGVTYRAGFNLKENRYVANVVNNTAAQIGEVIIGGEASGIKGYYTTVKVQTDETTAPGQMKELYSVGTDYVLSSY